MQEYSITNEKGEWLTGSIEKQCYVWTKTKECRYTWNTFEAVCNVATKYTGIVLRE